MNLNPLLRVVSALFAAALLQCVCAPAYAAAPSNSCSKLVLEGEVTAGHEWKAPLGQGWLFRIVPVPPIQAGYSGWDLAVDRSDPAGFPDALYLATPPFGSINEREIATTFGLRAQDAIGWNPRTFHFLIDPKSFHEAQQAYPSASSVDPKAMNRLLELQKNAASGEFRILHAHLVPGTADPAPFAQQWALAASRTPHQIESSANSQGSSRGELRSLRFRLTLWLPAKWAFPPGAHPTPSPCGQ
ncbi:hypothetical protein [Occallatibacter riparius]|uniref:Uncharacterized protein n=1 Tax=Occallatibacter riparius TaxID=1002689 RepID=A0A9J7BSG8_9BACT|nr:hypothetical protein [Occallatibacter riparius]UWZ83981.1 hypothetical protein MOP44_25910 [Occallatibacter riparius]